MPVRLQQLLEVAAGWATSGHPMVGLSDGTYYAGGAGDDPGMYLVVPWLARTFGWSVRSALDVFLIGLVALGVVLGWVGVLCLFRSTVGRMVGLAGVALLGLYALQIGDVYVTSFVAAASALPAVVVVRARRWPLLAPFGILYAVLNTMRSNTALAALAFVVVLVALSPWRWQDKGRALSALAVGLVLVVVGFARVTASADRFLDRQPNVYTEATPVGSETIDWRGAPRGHPVWHSVYVGFGYRPNDHGIVWADENAIAHVADVDPTIPYLSADYDGELRSGVVELVRDDPGFVVGSLVARAETMLHTLVACAGVGIVLALLRRLERRLLVAFVAALALSAAPAVLVTPLRPYLLGLVSFSVIFSLWAVDQSASTEGFSADRSSLRSSASMSPRV